MTPLNVQPPEFRDYHADGSLELVGTPWLTIQGEGPFAGRPAVFVRLAGCNLTCPGCDTLYTVNRKRFDWREIWNQIILCRGDNRKTELVVFTGGEPFRQNMVPLVPELMHNDWEVQIETNGTIFPEFDDPFPFAAYNLTLVCSPKTPTINPKFHRHVQHLKYILDAEHVADDGLPLTTLGNDLPAARPWPGFSGTIWVQPMDPRSPVDQDGGFGCTEEYQRNVNAAVASCLKFGYRYSHQVHKEIGVP
jgi:7-carboxy-7-deazaguanine synthase